MSRSRAEECAAGVLAASCRASNVRTSPSATGVAGYAASVHYGGTFPMTQSDKELTVEPCCRLRGTRSVYLADGSVFPHLPAKGLTFTMMANANRIGMHLCHILKDPYCELSSASA